MKALIIGLAFLSTAALAGDPVQAKLIGQRVVSSFPGSPVLVCQYQGSEARYEVVASTRTCAPSLPLSDEPQTSAGPAALARVP
jgi:hypothetical protein